MSEIQTKEDTFPEFDNESKSESTEKTRENNHVSEHTDESNDVSQQNTHRKYNQNEFNNRSKRFTNQSKHKLSPAVTKYDNNTSKVKTTSLDYSYKTTNNNEPPVVILSPELSPYEKLCIDSNNEYTKLSMYTHRLELIHQYAAAKDDKTYHYILMARRKNRYHTIQITLQWNGEEDKNEIYFNFLTQDIHAQIQKHHPMVYTLEDTTNLIHLTNTFIFNFKTTVPLNHTLLYSDINYLRKQCTLVLTTKMNAIKKGLKYTIQKVITIILTYMPLLEVGRKMTTCEYEKLESKLMPRMHQPNNKFEVKEKLS